MTLEEHCNIIHCVGRLLVIVKLIEKLSLSERIVV